MVTDRLLTAEDMPLLAESIARDEHHKEHTRPEFFTAYGTVCKVYEDEQGVICFVRGTKALRLDVQFADKADEKRNSEALSQFDKLAELARANGFTEIVTTATDESLRAFCKDNLGFIESEGEMRFHL